MIVVEVNYEQKDYARAIRSMTRRQNRLFNFFLLLSAIIISLWLYVRDPFGFGFGWWIVPVVLGVLVLWYGLMRLLGTAKISRQLKSAPAAQGTHIWTIGDEGVSIKGAISQTEHKWEAIIKARESNDDFFFYTAPRFAQFLPKRNIDTQSLASLRSLVVERLGAKAKIL